MFKNEAELWKDKKGRRFKIRIIPKIRKVQNPPFPLDSLSVIIFLFAHFGSSNGWGPSRAFPTGFLSPSSAVSRANSTSTLPWTMKASQSTDLSRTVHSPLIETRPESLHSSTVQSLATNLFEIVHSSSRQSVASVYRQDVCERTDSTLDVSKWEQSLLFISSLISLRWADVSCSERIHRENRPLGEDQHRRHEWRFSAAVSSWCFPLERRNLSSRERFSLRFRDN